MLVNQRARKIRIIAVVSDILWVIVDFLEKILLQRICQIYMRNPLKRPNKSGKDCFCSAGICKRTVVFKLKIYKLQMFNGPTDIKCSFVSSNFVLFRISRTAEVHSEHSRTSTMELFAQIVKGFRLLTIFIKSSIIDIRLGFEYASEQQALLSILHL